MAGTVTNKSLDDVFSAMPTGSLDKAIFNHLYGINHRQIRGMVPSNRNMSGLTFFTRPQLNMQRDNLRNVRQLAQLLNSNPASMQTFMRCTLDPRLMTGIDYRSNGAIPSAIRQTDKSIAEKGALIQLSGGSSIPAIKCPVVDNLQAFIPVLTNSVVSQSGWPSISVPSFTSKAGLYNESFSMVDGRVLNNEVWDLNVNFRNTRGNPILHMFYIWALYMAAVFEGKLVPYLDMITENEIDYNTRIYRLTLDYQKRYVTGIAASHASYPVGVPIGDEFNESGDQPYNEANKEIGMSFRCMGVDYYDDILIKEFNDVVAIANPSMADDVRDSAMMPIPYASINAMNHQGYPRIEPSTGELRFYTSQANYKTAAGKALAAITEYNPDSEIGS